MIDNEFLNLLKEDEKVLYIYQYGSSVYGVQSEDSDTDFLVITEKHFEIPENFINFAYEIEHTREDRIIHNLKYKNCDFIFYTSEDWFDMIMNNCIEAWECASLNRKFIHKECVKIPVKLNQIALRQEVSAICSNAYVKAKKKIKQGDYYIGKKSL